MTKNKVVLVPFPFDDLSSSKVRPAVCLTDPIGPHQHVILAFITSRVAAQPLATDVVLDVTDPGFASTGLRVSSTLQLHRLMTATTSLISRELGQLAWHTQAQVRDKLRKLFGLEEGIG
jgi:mRNA interferase MazF